MHVYICGSVLSVYVNVLHVQGVKNIVVFMCIACTGFEEGLPMCIKCFACRVHVSGTVSSLEASISSGVVEASVDAVSQHMATALQLIKVLTHSHKNKQQEAPLQDHFYRYVSREELTAGRLMEVVESAGGGSSSLLSKQAMRGGKPLRKGSRNKPVRGASRSQLVSR